MRLDRVRQVEAHHSSGSGPTRVKEPHNRQVGRDQEDGRVVEGHPCRRQECHHQEWERFRHRDQHQRRRGGEVRQAEEALEEVVGEETQGQGKTQEHGVRGTATRAVRGRGFTPKRWRSQGCMEARL